MCDIWTCSEIDKPRVWSILDLSLWLRTIEPGILRSILGGAAVRSNFDMYQLRAVAPDQSQVGLRKTLSSMCYGNLNSITPLCVLDSLLRETLGNLGCLSKTEGFNIKLMNLIRMPLSLIYGTLNLLSLHLRSVGNSLMICTRYTVQLFSSVIYKLSGCAQCRYTEYAVQYVHNSRLRQNITNIS